MRNSLRYVSWKERKAVARDLLFGYPDPIRRAIYTTNAIESLNASLRRVTKKRGAFPTPDAVRKVLFLAIERVSARWTRPIKNWTAALNHFAIAFEGRVER